MRLVMAAKSVDTAKARVAETPVTSDNLEPRLLDVRRTLCLCGSELDGRLDPERTRRIVVAVIA